MPKASDAVADLPAFPFGSAVELAAALREGRVGAVELLQAYLDRVDAFNPAVNAVVVDDRERALRDAEVADRARASGAELGPLHGVPMTVKESFSVPGLPTTFGAPANAANIASVEAVAVSRLRAAGAVIFGKTNVPLGLADFQSFNDVYGTSNNPWDLTRGTGGSSGGSAAALAAGLTGLEFGSDIGGSIRNPAAYNGVYGHKPTFGIIPKRGHTVDGTVLAEGDISVVGPLGRSAADLALALDVTAGPDLESGYRLDLPEPPGSVSELRVAVWLEQPDLSPVSEAVTAAVHAAAEALGKAGATVSFTARPDLDPAAAHGTYAQLLFGTMGARDVAFDDTVAKAAALDPADTSDRATTMRLSTVRHRDFVLAQTEQARLRWAWRSFFKDWDVLLAPITATPAFPHDHSLPETARTMLVDGRPVPYFAQLFWAGLAIAGHLPATVAPVGTSPEGLPIGLQIMGDGYADRTTIWTAERLAELVGGFVPPPGY